MNKLGDLTLAIFGQKMYYDAISIKKFINIFEQVDFN